MEGDRQSRASQKAEVDCRSPRLRGLMADRCWSALTRIIILEMVTARCASDCNYLLCVKKTTTFHSSSLKKT